jgi:hypothetical protein
MIVRIYALILAVVSASVAASAFADDLPKYYSDDDLVEILKDDGFRAVEKTEDRVLQIKIDGQLYFLYVYEDDDLQLYYGLTDFYVTPEDMNTWNRTMRLSRAYLDTDNDPILEADLLANSGVSPDQITEWVSVFVSSSQAFRRFLTERNREDEAVQAAVTE